jgi:hypothetical protein
MQMWITWRSAAVLVIASLAVTGVLAIVSAQDGRGGAGVFTPLPDLNRTNRSPDLENIPSDYRPGPTPVTLFRAEMSQSVLPGPRYMAFGPSIIEVSIDPRLLAVVFAGAFAGLSALVILVMRRSRGNDMGGR